MIEHSCNIRVRYAESDQMGFAHHSNYIIWFEHGRIQFLKEIGLSYAELERRGFLIPVLEVKAQFLKYAVFDEQLTIKTRITAMPGAKQQFEYDVLNGSGEMVCKGESTHTFMNDKNKAIRPPKEFIERIKPYFGN